MGLFKPLHDYVDSLVHASAQEDAPTAARHRAFIAHRLAGSLVILAIFPLYLAVRGIPSALELSLVSWVVVPILIASFLSRTGRYDDAHILSSVALTGLIVAWAIRSGGIASFAAVWLVVIPLEAVLTGSRRASIAALVIALAGGLALFAFPTTAPLRNDNLTAFAFLSAGLYAAVLAHTAQTLFRKSLGLFSAQENRYRLLAANMTDVLARHGRNGAVLFISPAAENLFGANAGDLIGHGLFDRVHVADRPAYLSALNDAAAGEERFIEFRVRRYVHASASLHPVHHVWLEMRCRPIDRGADLNVAESEVVSVMRDISHRKAQEQAVEQAREESEQANAAKSHFLATMSHELRTPLNAIIGFSQMLGDETQIKLDPARRQDYAKLINESGHHLLSIVNSILDMSKMEAGDFEILPEAFLPAAIVSSCCQLLDLKARESGVEIRISITDELPEMVADKRAVKQILLNLLSNSIKFTDRGGQVNVAASVNGTKLVIVVDDNGIGISANDLRRVGSPFFQARSSYDRKHDGTGLGLSIVKGLIALHGGEMKIRSELGVGTSVSIALPLDCRAPTSNGTNKVTHANFSPQEYHANGMKKIA